MIRRLLDSYRQSRGARASALMVAAIAGASVGGYLFNLVAIRWLGASGTARSPLNTSLTLLVLLPHLDPERRRPGGRAPVVDRSQGGGDRAFRHWLVRMLGLGLLLGGATVARYRSDPGDRLGIESAASVWLTAAAIGVSTVLPVTHEVLGPPAVPLALRRAPSLTRSCGRYSLPR